MLTTSSSFDQLVTQRMGDPRPLEKRFVRGWSLAYQPQRSSVDMLKSCSERLSQPLLPHSELFPGSQSTRTEDSNVMIEYLQSTLRLPSVLPKRDVLSFLMSVRQLVEEEQLTAARKLLDAAPIHIQSDAQVARLRFLLAPPIVSRIAKCDSDRRREYEWLQTEGSKYRGQWIAVRGNELLASAANLRDLRRMLVSITVTPPPLIHRVD